MLTSQNQASLRLWPGIALVAAQWTMWSLVPRVFADGAGVGVLGGIGLGLLVLLWWLFFSRAPWSERVGFVALMIVAVFVTRRFVDRSIEIEFSNEEDFDQSDWDQPTVKNPYPTKPRG